MHQSFINIFREIKIKTKSFWDLSLQSYFLPLGCKRYSICLTSLSNSYESFPAFISANNIEILVNNLFGFNIFNLFASFISSLLHFLRWHVWISKYLSESSPSSEDVLVMSLSTEVYCFSNRFFRLWFSFFIRFFL